MFAPSGTLGYDGAITTTQEPAVTTTTEPYLIHSCGEPVDVGDHVAYSSAAFDSIVVGFSGDLVIVRLLADNQVRPLEVEDLRPATDLEPSNIAWVVQ